MNRFVGSATFAYIAMVLTADCSVVRGAFLEGKTLQVNYEYVQDEQSSPIEASISGVVVGPGVELMGFGQTIEPPLPPRVDIDFSDTQILITLIIDESPALFEIFRFIDETNTIPSLRNAKLNPTSTWNNVSIPVPSDEGIQLSIQPVGGLAGQFVLIDVVPEPAAAGLMLIGLAAVGALGRRRRL